MEKFSTGWEKADTHRSFKVDGVWSSAVNFPGRVDLHLSQGLRGVDGAVVVSLTVGEARLVAAMLDEVLTDVADSGEAR